WIVSQQYVSTENAFLDGNLVRIAPQVSGPIAGIDVEENAHVNKGDLLLRLDPADYQVALRQAKTRLDGGKAQVEQAQAQLSVAQTGVSRANAQVAVARTRAENAAGDLGRFEKDNARAVSRQKVESANHQVKQTRAALEAARQG